METAKRHKTGLLIREVDGELIVLDTEQDRVHQFNESASLIWRLYESGCDASEIADTLASVYELDKDRAAQDVRRALGEFRDLELVT